MKNVLCFFALFFLCKSILAQQYQIKWGEPATVSRRLDSFLPFSDSTFYTIQNKYYGLDSMKINQISALNRIQPFDFSPLPADTSCKLIQLMKLNGKLTSIYVRTGVSEKIICLQKYSPELKADGSEIQLATFPFTIGSASSANFTFLIHVSPDNRFFCIEHQLLNSKTIDNETNTYAYFVYSDQLSVINKGEYTLPKKNSRNSYFVNNSGDYFIVSSVLGEKEIYTELNTSSLFLDKVTFKIITANQDQDEVELELSDGRRISDYTFFISKNRIITFTGTYSGGIESSGKGVNGMFFYQFDFNKKLLISEKYRKFSVDVIGDDWTESKKNQAQRRMDRGVSNPELFEYKTKNLIELPDGSYIGILERQHYFNHFTYFDDIICYKINPREGFNWIRKIHKSQFSKFEKGYYSSFGVFVNSENLVLLFNDEQENYGMDGAYIAGKKKYIMCNTRTQNPLCVTVFNLEDGNYQREVFENPDGKIYYAVPKKFKLDPDEKRLIILMRKDLEEKYGVLLFD